MSRPRTAVCTRGHAMTDDNVYMYRGTRKGCRQCRAITARGPTTVRKGAPRIYVQAPLLAIVGDMPRRELGRRYADRFGITELSGMRTVERMFAEPALTLAEADRLAILVGRHPALLWPKEYAQSAG